MRQIKSYCNFNLGSFRTWSRLVTNHSEIHFNYATVPNWKTKHHYYYFEGEKNFKIKKESGWYDMYNNNDSLYYYAGSGRPKQIRF